MLDLNQIDGVFKMKYPIKYGLNVSVEIIRDNISDNAQIKVYAPMYINKEWIMKHSYKSSQFTDNQILNDADFHYVLCKHYLI